MLERRRACSHLASYLVSYFGWAAERKRLLASASTEEGDATSLQRHKGTSCPWHMCAGGASPWPLKMDAFCFKKVPMEWLVNLPCL